MSVKSFSWPQVSAWRMSQHGLEPRLPRVGLVSAAARTGGVQAQVMSAAELALGARLDGLTPLDVQAALWQARTLVKTWAMRATLHLLPADELPLYVAARSVHAGRNWSKYFEFFGITPEQAEAFLAAVPQVLGGEPMRREQLAAAVAEYTGEPELARKLLGSSWGSLWKPSAWRGDLCFGPNQGRNVTFVRPSVWLGAWQPVEPYPALQEIARRYLRSYGPTTPGKFGLWWGIGITAGRKVFQSLADELEEVDVEGWRAFVLRESLEAMQRIEASDAVRLLPLFDAYVLGLERECESILPAAHRRRVFRPQGWISAVVLAGGVVKGTWEYRARGGQTIVTLRPFAPLSPSVQAGVEAEVERLGSFWQTKVGVEYV